jgi:hypothetical protein
LDPPFHFHHFCHFRPHPIAVVVTMMNRMLILLLIIFLVCLEMAHALVSPPTFACKKQSSPLMMAGFGASKEQSKKETKLKPKAQWDRYASLKKELGIRVAVRVVKDGEDWLEVGRVRSKDNQYTEIAIAKQRAIIAYVSWCVCECAYIVDRLPYHHTQFYSRMPHHYYRAVLHHSTHVGCFPCKFLKKTRLNGGTGREAMRTAVGSL